MNVLMPSTLDEALQLLVTHPDAVPMAGGTDLLVHWPSRLESRGRTYLDLSGLDMLRHYQWHENELVLGGLTTYWDLIRDERCWCEYPILISAARMVGALQIQTRGTWAGNIVNASPAADGVPVLMAHDAAVVLQSATSTEEVPLSEFYLGYKQMKRTPDQLIVAIRIPRRRHDVQIFEKVGSRNAQTITKVGVTVTHSDAGWRVVASSVAPTIRRCPTIESMLEQSGPASSPQDYLPAIRTDVAPIDDIRSTADYRLRVMSRVLHAALTNNPGSPTP